MYYLKNNTRKYMMYSVEKYILSNKLSKLQCNIYDVLFKNVYCMRINYIYSNYTAI